MKKRNPSLEAARILGRRGGKFGAEGGRVAAGRMTKAQRVACAKKAAAASAKVRTAKKAARKG